MDVHKETTRVVLLPEGSKEFLEECTVPTRQVELCRQLLRWGRDYELRCYYEAGPAGYVPYRWLTGVGVACTVIAPSKTPRAPGERVKTDKRDARRLARQGTAGALVAVAVPTPEQEAARSVVRCREVRLKDELGARHRVLKFLGTRGHYYLEGKHWTQAHWRWLRGQGFSDLEAWTWQEYVADLVYRQDRLAAASRQVGEVARRPEWAETVGRIICFRGLDVVSAMVIATETLDFARFGTAPAYMSYWGLTCAEESSGESRHLSRITKCGSSRARRIWVEAAWHYRHKPRLSKDLAARQVGQSPLVIAHAWKAQLRLHKKFWRIAARKDTGTAAVAVARELAGFIWGVMQGEVL
jgi:transposase